MKTRDVGMEKPINLVKMVAVDCLPSVIKRVGVEDTPENREDIMALALNRLPVKYVTSSEGKLYSEMIDNFKVQFETDILAGLTRAAIQVKGKPRGAMKMGDK